jgi:hypothetical protein
VPASSDRTVSRLVEDNEVVVCNRTATRRSSPTSTTPLHFIKGDVLDYDATRKQ